MLIFGDQMVNPKIDAVHVIAASPGCTWHAPLSKSVVDNLSDQVRIPCRRHADRLRKHRRVSRARDSVQPLAPPVILRDAKPWESRPRHSSSAKPFPRASCAKPGRRPASRQATPDSVGSCRLACALRRYQGKQVRRERAAQAPFMTALKSRYSAQPLTSAIHFSIAG